MKLPSPVLPLFPVRQAVASLLLVLSAIPAAAAPVPDDGAEVLTRGPIHEAFAETVTFKPVAGTTVARPSPAPIEELPPDQRPEGANISWIPGYWAWDDEADGFLWISGIWRNLPPGRQWMPGYWAASGEQFQWVSGYWADAALADVEYLGEPPASIEAGPGIKAPSADHIWIPGSWLWRASRYQWRPGYWDRGQADWLWVPSYYVRTPRGYVYVDGYWDYSFARRGMIFAPVRFSGNSWSRPDYVYRPDTVISLVALVDHLFLRPRQRHYYFGDYYAPEYHRSGYYASWSYNTDGHGYDPVHVYNRWSHRDDAGWERRHRENFQYFREHSDERPPHTLAAFAKFSARGDGKHRVAAGFATPLEQFAARGDRDAKLKPVNDSERQALAAHGREIRDFGDQRRKLDARPAGEPDHVPHRKGMPDRTEPVRVKAARSPVAAKAVAQPATEDTPPRRESAPPEAPDSRKKGDRKPGKSDPRPAEPGAGPNQKPEPEPKADPGRERRPDPKKEPKVKPEPEPRMEPKQKPEPDPRAEPGHQPQPDPKKEPKVKPQPEPRAEPKQKPEPEPKREPARDPKNDPGEKDRNPDKDRKPDKDKDKPKHR